MSKIGPGKKAPEAVNILVQVPAGSGSRYVLDEGTGILRLEEKLDSSYPHGTESGIIPGTEYEDGKPLEALIMMEESTFPGCLVEGKPIGMLKVKEGGVFSDKILAVLASDPLSKQITELEDVPQHVPDEISRFFEKGERKSEGWQSSTNARKAIEHSINLYNRRKK